MKIDHELKILPCYLEAVKCGDKTFEIRYNLDRGFQKGDIIKLINLENGCDTIVIKISYVTSFKQQEDYVVFGFQKISEPNNVN